MLFICLALSSCRSVRQVTQTNDTITESNKIKVVNYRDTIFFTPKSTTGLNLPISSFINCPETLFKDNLNNVETTNKKPQVWSQKNGNAKVIVKYIHDTLQVTAECDSIALSAKIKQELQKEFDSKNTREHTQEQKTTGYNFWDLVKAAIVGFIVAIIGILIIKLSK